MTSGAEPIYDGYAPIYDLIGQARFGERMARWTLGWLAGRGIQVRRVLDLACGTGAATLIFAEDGRQVVGIDRSAAMLAMARGRARDAGCAASFIAGDIRALAAGDEGRTKDERRTTNDERRTTNERTTADCRLPTDKTGQSVSLSACQLVSLPSASFDLATCFYDSLNYLTGDGDLAHVFGGVARALRPGGWLVFDLNMEAEYATWDERDVVTHDSRDCMVYNRLDYDARTRRATGRIVWFVRETDRWWRGEETHTERCWSDAEVCAALAQGGLALATRLSAVGDGLAEPADAVPRVIYIAQRG